MPFYVWFLFAGAVSAIFPICRALNGLPESGGYIFLAVLLTAIRAVTWWGLFTRKLWGWYLNFATLLGIPILKALVSLQVSPYRDSENIYGAGALAVAVVWIIYAVPNAVYFRKRKHLFDDGEGPYKTLLEKGWGFRVLDTQVVSEHPINAVPLPSAAAQVPLSTKYVSLIEGVSVKSDDCILNDDKWEDVAMVNLSDKSDEQFFEIAQREFDAGDIAKGLMLKAEVATGGDAEKTRLLYIRTRAQELASEARKMIEDAAPRPMEDDLARKRRAKLNRVTGAIIATVLVFIIGFLVVKGKQEAKLRLEAKLRFTVVTYDTERTVIDNLTGLEWVQAPHLLPGNSSRMDWKRAADFCSNLVYAGYSDWRLPTVGKDGDYANAAFFNLMVGDFNKAELNVLFKQGGNPSREWKGFVGTPFSGVQSDYWSGTSYDTDKAWDVNMGGGYVDYSPKTSRDHYVWPVRGVQ